MQNVKKYLFLLSLVTLLSISFFGCELTQPDDEIIYVPGTISYYDGGKIRSGTLVNNYRINDVSYRFLTVVYFYENGRVEQGHLNGNSTIADIIYKDNTSISFYTNGQVSRGCLIGNQSISNVNYSPNDIHFYLNGRVKQGQLNGEQMIDNANYSDDYWIRFNSDGTVVSSSSNYDPNF